MDWIETNISENIILHIFKGFDCSGFPNGNWPGGPPGFGPPRNSTRGFYGPRPHNFPTLGARLLFGPSSQPRWGHPGYY